MEEKLTKLILISKEFTEKSKKYYADIHYNGTFNRIELSIRLKKEHDYVETVAIALNYTGVSKVDKMIELIKKYEEE